MKKSSKRTLSRFLAGVMIVTSVFGSTYVSAAETVDTADATVAVEESITSDAAVEALEASVEPMEASVTPMEAGKTYEVNFAALGDEGYTYPDTLTPDQMAENPNAVVNGKTFADGTIGIKSDNNTAYTHDTSHGLAIGNGDEIYFDVPGHATIEFKTCQYGNVSAFTINGDSFSLGQIEEDGTVRQYKYLGEAGRVSVVAVGSGFLHSISVKTEPKVTGNPKDFTLWLDDIATQGASGPEVAPGELSGVVKDGIDLGDSKLTLSIGSDVTAFTPYKTDLTVNGREHVNGYKGGARHGTPNDITTIPKIGDGSLVIFTPAATGMFKTYFDSTSFIRVWDFDAATGERYEKYYDSDPAAGSYAFNAEIGHTYVLSTTGKTSNLSFIAFEYYVDEAITANLTWTNDGEYDGHDKINVTFMDSDMGTEKAVVPYGTESVKLVKGHVYEMVSDDGGSEPQIDGSVTFKAEEKADGYAINCVTVRDVTMKGKFTGGPADSVKSISFMPATHDSRNHVTKPRSGRDPIEGTLTADGYTVVLKPGVYITSVVADGYTTYDRMEVLRDTPGENDVYLESLAKDYYDLPAEISAANSAIKFSSGCKYNNDKSIGAKAGDTIVIPVSGKKIVEVAGWNSGSWNINGKSETDATGTGSSNPAIARYETDGTETEVTVNITSTTDTTYLWWVRISDNTGFVKEISVPGDYATLKEAVAAINSMPRPEGEEGRVTIKLTDDIQEQIVFDAPYVTLDGQGHEINWYYGQTGFYYSVDPSTGLYSETLFHDRFEKIEGNGSLWGGVAIIRGDNFIAENTTFRNTFNYEVTDKEIEDGAEGRNSVKGIMKKDTDVTVYSAKERSNAFYIEAKNIEIYNCQILSSQDTFGRNGNATGYGPVYVKDSVIRGNTDFICGEFAAVFDNCELRWMTYDDEASVSNNAKVGYLIAPKTNPYIFRNCYVTIDENTPGGTARGMLGRTWGAKSNATFLNLETNGYISTDAWGEMSKGDSATSTFAEYNTTVNGIPFETNSSVNNVKKLTKEEADKLLGNDIIADALGGWTPKYYELAPVDNKVEPDGVWGDVDKSGVLTSNDAALVFAYTLKGGMIANTANDKGELKYNFTVADVDADSAITANDAANILTKVVDPSFKFAVEDAVNAPDANKINVFIVGDSTACHYASTEDPKYWYKRVGFGDKVADYLTDDVNVVNLALSGRSSKSFATGINENGNVDSAAVTNYAILKDNIKEGDFLIIAWGHNDEKDDVYRHTDGVGDETVEGSFQNSLYNNYIKIAQDAKAEPILVTPIIRGNASGTLGDNDVHLVGDAKVDYAKPIKDLGAKLGITVIDQLANTKNLYETMTAAEAWKDPKALDFQPPQGYAKLHAVMQDGGSDTTHLNAYGASYVAYMLASDIAKSTSGLAKYVKANITAPEFKHEDCYNTNWEPFDETEYIPSSIWKVTAPWAGSVFGVGIGTINEDSHDNFDIIENIAEKSVQLIARNKKGKVQSGSDGFVMYFQEIDAKQDFTLTATAHINSYNAAENQTAFGLMLRDNMFTDHEYATAAPYVLVGNVAQNSGKQQIPYFRRLSESVKVNDKTVTLDTRAALATEATADTFKPGDEIKLEISRKGDAVTVKYGDLDPVTYLPVDGDYKCDLTKVRADKDYVGVCVTRLADVTFKDIDFQLQ